MTAIARAERRCNVAIVALSRYQPGHMRAMWSGRLRRARTEAARAYRLVYARADKAPAMALAHSLRAQGWPLLGAWDRALALAGLPSRYARRLVRT